MLAGVLLPELLGSSVLLDSAAAMPVRVYKQSKHILYCTYI
jgi:hypothetical protein